MYKKKCENPDCGVMIESESPQTRFCSDCAKLRKVERDKKYALIGITCKGRQDKEKLQALFKEIKFEFISAGVKVTKYEIAERALTMYLAYLEENE